MIYVSSMQSSVVDPSFLNLWIERGYDLSGMTRCLYYDGGSCDVYRVESSRHLYWCKIYRPDSELEIVEEEARLVADLGSVGMGVALPIRRRDGRFSKTIASLDGNRPVMLFENISGSRRPKCSSARDFRFAGYLLSKLHSLADSLNRDYSLRSFHHYALASIDIAAIERIYVCPHQDLTELRSIGKAVECSLIKLLDRSHDVGICHNDPGPGNIRIDDRGNGYLFDFEHTAYSPRAYELSLWIGRASKIASSPYEAQYLIDAFLGAYASLRPIPRDIFNFEIFLAVRRLIMLSAVAYKYSRRIGINRLANNFVKSAVTTIRGHLDSAASQDE